MRSSDYRQNTAADVKHPFFSKTKESGFFFRSTLDCYRAKQRISDEDARNLATLLNRYSEFPEKVGIGVNHSEIMSADFGTQCFRLVRVDGTGEDFLVPALHHAARSRVMSSMLNI